MEMIYWIESVHKRWNGFHNLYEWGSKCIVQISDNRNELFSHVSMDQYKIFIYTQLEELFV